MGKIKEFNNKTVLVTGGNSGIGACIAKNFGKNGANVIIHYLERKDVFYPESSIAEAVINEKNGALAIKSEIEKQGGNAEIISANLASLENITSFYNKAVAIYGKIDILVNNAAHCELPDSIEETSLGSISRHFEVNTFAPVLLIKQFVKHVRKESETRGRIVNISTDAAQKFANQISYGASKAALEAYTRSIAMEIGKYNITINTISPGPIQTGVYPKDLVERVSPDIPMLRFGNTEEISSVVTFLCSEAASYLTGQVIKVSGGHAL